MAIEPRTRFFQMSALLLLLGAHLSTVSGCSTGDPASPDSESTGGQTSCPNEPLGEPLMYDCDALQAESFYVKKACGGTAIAFFQTDAYINRVIDDTSGNVVFVEHGGLTTTPCTSGVQICDDLNFRMPPNSDFVPLAESDLCIGQGGMGGSE